MASFDDDEDDEYFSEADLDAELTGLEPKFVKIDDTDLTPTQLNEMTVDKLVPLYIACRNQLATDTHGYKLRKARVKNFMGLISMVLRDKADVVGTDTFKGTYGTAFRQTKEKFSISDWDQFSAWLLRTGNTHILQKRVAPNAVKEVREVEGLPPGINVFSEVEFAVRSPTAKRK